MTLNVGTVDRAIRLIAGIVLIGLAIADVIGPWGYLGVVLAATGALRFCPAYSLLGVNTCDKAS